MKSRAALVSVVFNVLQTVIKLVAALFTGSVSLLSEAIHSGTDIVASTVAYFSVRTAAAPPDEDHPYGHGKIESLTGFGESILLLIVCAYIAYHAVTHLQGEGQIQRLDAGMIVLAITGLGGLFAANYVKSAAKTSGSLALAANGQHLMVDVYTTSGVLAALAITKFTGFRQADPIVALVLSGWMAYGSIGMTRMAVQQLIDRRISDEEYDRLQEILKSDERLLGFHRLRTRLSGEVRHVDVHIVLSNDLSLVEAHDIADELESKIEQSLSPAHCVIHVDPYDAARDGGHV